MAINPSTAYPAQMDTTVPAEYPYGKAQDITAPDDGTGTPWISPVINDILGEQQAALSEAGVVPSGTPEKVGAAQVLASKMSLAAAATWAVGGGAANAHTATPVSGRSMAPTPVEGQTVTFVPTTTNTASATLQWLPGGSADFLRKMEDLTTGLTGYTQQPLVAGDIAKGVPVTVRREGSVWVVVGTPSISKYTMSGNIAVLDGSLAESFSMKTELADATYESVGPTGSGAAYEWAGLDGLPQGTKGIYVAVSIIAANTSPGSNQTASQIGAWVRRVGASGLTLVDETAVVLGGTAIAAGVSWHVRALGTAFVPLNSNGLFEAAWSDNSGSSSGDVKMMLKGYTI